MGGTGDRACPPARRQGIPLLKPAGGPVKRFAGFLVPMLALYALFMAPWPGVREAYAGASRVACQALLGSFGGRGQVFFRPSLRHEPGSMSVTLRRKGSRASTTGSIGTRYQGYVPTVLVISLVLATPLPWRRRWLALLWGLLLVNVFVLFRIALQILVVFETTPGLALYELGPFWIRFLSLVDEVVGTSTASSYIAAAVIWILVCFRRGDWELLMETPRQG